MSTKRHRWLGVLAIVLFGVVFFVPFAFILFTAAKTSDRGRRAPVLAAHHLDAAPELR